MKTFISYVAICFSLLFVMGCSNVEEVIVSCDEGNIAIIKGIAKKYGYNDVLIDSDCERFTPLTDQELQGYEGYFKELKRIDGMEVSLNQIVPITRVAESDSYHGEVSYGGNGFDVAVYWTKDNQTGEIANIEGGLGGSSLNIYEYPTASEVLNQSNGILYTMFYQGKILHGVGGGIIELTLKADLIMQRYSIVDGGIQLGQIYYNLTTKVMAHGTVDTNSHRGSFTVRSAGSGNWNEI